jgi:hypothetical protein
LQSHAQWLQWKQPSRWKSAAGHEAPAPSTVQSALEAVKGVSGVLKVENLIKAVTNAHGMNSYHAKFKKG